MKIYKLISLTMVMLFAVTGILFLGLPDKVVIFFNTLSAYLGMRPAPLTGWNLYQVLAVGYMYIVTILAFLMFKHANNLSFPLLLTHAKLASSLLSLAIFLLQGPYLIYLANFAVDAVIGVVVLNLYLRLRRSAWAYS